jgi:hypothetical protein
MPTRARSCEHKSPYPSEDAANAIIWRRVEAGVAPGLLQAYPCRWGNHWHVGHKSKRIRQQAMRAS